MTAAQHIDGDHPDGATVTLTGTVSAVRRETTRQGNPWATAVLEDATGSIDCLVYPAPYRLVADRLAEGAGVVVTGRLDKREDVPRLIVMELAATSVL
ncbi:OB-fold nucleic acid binding domain-containing protein [Streptomyces aculeolatus]